MPVFATSVIFVVFAMPAYSGIYHWNLPAGQITRPNPDLNSLAQWETDWQMKFNVAKCHSMRMTGHPPDKHLQFDYTLHQQRLEQVQSAKYLGITISDDFDWDQHISEISSKATKTAQFSLCT